MPGLGLRGVMLGSQEKGPKAEKHEGALHAEGQQVPGRRPVRAQHYSTAGSEAGDEVGGPGLVGCRTGLYLKDIEATRRCEAGNGLERQQTYHPSL